jgi:hypothetical protein
MDLVEAIKSDLEKKGHLHEIRNKLRNEISGCFRLNGGLQYSNLVVDGNRNDAGGAVQELVQVSLERKGVMDEIRADLRSKLCSCIQAGGLQ